MCIIHPLESLSRPLNNSVLADLVSRTVRRRTRLYSHLFHLVVLQQPVEFALQAAFLSSLGKLHPVRLQDFVPRLTEICPVIPDEVHLFYGVFRARRSSRGLASWVWWRSGLLVRLPV